MYIVTHINMDIYR